MDEVMKERGLKNAETLLPCPFCGGKPHVTDRASHDGNWIWFVVCYCGGYSARAHQFGYSEEEVIERWNTRWTK